MGRGTFPSSSGDLRVSGARLGSHWLISVSIFAGVAASGDCASRFTVV